MNDQPESEETLKPGGHASSGAQESGAGYGNAQTGGKQGGGAGDEGSDPSLGNPERADEAVHRSETIAAEDIELAGDDDPSDDE